MRKLVAELTTAAMVVSMVASPVLGTTTNGSEVVNTGDKNTVVNNTNTTTSVVVSNNNTMQVAQRLTLVMPPQTPHKVLLAIPMQLRFLCLPQPVAQTWVAS